MHDPTERRVQSAKNGNTCNITFCLAVSCIFKEVQERLKIESANELAEAATCVSLVEVVLFLSGIQILLLELTQQTIIFESVVRSQRRKL
ncbi:hypothetical protein Ocin01_11501 [Orchesella cincta]|uniref:Uncharacterized protein n=1 Tax=Orchesella cincta TaxID=48709 RepID=A0A1D2MQP1_ORCCI|nr:hypothetical protein Ocin01_11501 [Orchesella cincta]